MADGIRKFYAGKSIFITGASGFMGKVLLEKLLYSCSDLKEIFILMRPKRGKTGAERVQDFSTIPVIMEQLLVAIRSFSKWRNFRFFIEFVTRNRKCSTRLLLSMVT